MALMMASDASRRLLDDGSISCRIKLPQSLPNNTRPANSGAESSQQMAPTAAMDVPLESTSPSSRRNKGKIVEALQSMGNLNSNLDTLELPTDPDAQTTVTDFLDFTEYLPADMIRSLTLVGNLDEKYCENSVSVHELTAKYGKLPTLPADGKPDPVTLRADISEHINQAVTARTLAHAEATRMADNVDRHFNRAKNILAKLEAMMDTYPSSREASPAPQKAKSPTATRAPKILLRVGASSEAASRVRKHRAPRITVPGEVLAPYELDYESYGSESDISSSEEEEPITPRATPGGTVPKLKLKVSRKDRMPKPPRGPRPPGQMGTNVHSQVAGISTSNALAKLKPPPPDAKKGDDSLPWLQLNDWELAHLRKRMKKNAIWSPSDTMIARELKQLGRGYEAYKSAKAQAEATGEPFDQPEPPQLRGETVHAEGAISVEALRLEPSLSNRGMKLNEAKKLKKENQAKELAKQAAEEAEESARKMALAAKAMAGIFENKDKKPPAKTPSKPAKKRKRESPPPDAEGEKGAEKEAAKAARPPLKRNKTETPVPVPQPISTKQTSPILPPESGAPSISSEAAPLATPTEGPMDMSGLPILAPAPAPTPALPVLSPKKSSTPILPPQPRKAVKKEAMKKEVVRKEPVKKDAAKKDVKKEVKKPEPVASAALSRPRRTSGVETSAPPTPVVAEPQPPKRPASRPTSSRSNKASVEPHQPIPSTATATIDRPRRASTARNTPAPEPRQPSKRTKRPAPGVVTAGSEGSTTVSVGKRSTATRKKAGAKKEKKDGREGSAAQEAYDEVDDEGNIIDPDEPRYCLCNRVSFGTMIGCENNDCEKEWFHLECVGLTEIPARTTKWYCPECRVALGIGEKGEINARGKKK